MICDLAETYRVYDWRALPIKTAASLAMGLGPDSRIGRKISGAPAPIDTLLLAMMTDCLRVLAWRQTRDGLQGINPPASILQQFYPDNAEENGFETVDEFNAWRESMLEV